MRVLMAGALLTLIGVFPAQAAPAGGSDSESALMIQPSTDNAKYEPKRPAPQDQDKKTQTKKKPAPSQQSQTGQTQQSATPDGNPH